MEEQTLKSFKKFVKNWKKESFKASFELICELFIKANFNKQNQNYFFKNASSIIEEIRVQSFNELKNNELSSLDKVFKYLFKEAKINDLKTQKIVSDFLKKFFEHIYSLNLSLTQSRRSRAGKEFENLIELIFYGTNISVDNQCNIKNKGLKKLVDFVSPSGFHYQINKEKVIFISVKTTLRERWQEVVDEMKQTEIKEIYLITLDEKLTQNLLNTFQKININLVTLKSIKEKCYFKNNWVITIEELLKICKNNEIYWANCNYSSKEKIEIEKALRKKIERYSKLKVN